MSDFNLLQFSIARFILFSFRTKLNKTMQRKSWTGEITDNLPDASYKNVKRNFRLSCVSSGRKGETMKNSPLYIISLTMDRLR